MTHDEYKSIVLEYMGSRAFLALNKLLKQECPYCGRSHWRVSDGTPDENHEVICTLSCDCGAKIKLEYDDPIIHGVYIQPPLPGDEMRNAEKAKDAAIAEQLLRLWKKICSGELDLDNE